MRKLLGNTCKLVDVIQRNKTMPVQTALFANVLLSKKGLSVQVILCLEIVIQNFEKKKKKIFLHRKISKKSCCILD